MPGTTTNRGYTYPVLSDPDQIPQDIQALAESVDADVDMLTGGGKSPVGDSSNSVTLTSADVLLTGSAQTTILTKTFTLARQQQVMIMGKARIDNGGAAAGSVGLHIVIDGAVNALSHAGPIVVEIDAANRQQMTTGMFTALLAAGSHTIDFKANRDSTGQLSAIASGSLSTGPTYHPTALIIIV